MPSMAISVHGRGGVSAITVVAFQGQLFEEGKGKRQCHDVCFQNKGSINIKSTILLLSSSDPWYWDRRLG